jgi:L-threonylcarbamoyladenylate synthase
MNPTEKSDDAAAVERAIDRLRQGDLVAVPTETVYGLAADSTNAAAIAKIYRTKGRPDFNPLIVHIADLEAAETLGAFNDLAHRLAQKYWPGPLTLVLPRHLNSSVAPAVTAGLSTIALRCPAHPLMRTLLEKSGYSLAAPSANKSGKISPTTADHVRQSLGDVAPMILDGGPCQAGIESTIVAVRNDHYQILRPGPITAEDLQSFLGQAAISTASDKIEAPGQLASHYAPSKPVRLNVPQAEADEFHVGFADIAGNSNLSPTGDLAEAAANLFACLHEADASDSDRIAVAPIPKIEMGLAINDRLARAAKNS